MILTGLLPIFRSLGALLIALRRRNGQSATWLSWLGVALLIALVLSPGTVTASRLAFQSSPPATPEPPAPTAPPEPEPPTPTPVPPTPVPPAQVQPTPVPPTSAPAPTVVAPTQELPPAQIQPTQPAPAPTPILPPSPTPPTFPAQTPTWLPPPPAPTVQSSSQTNPPIVNWVKFWDTLAITFAYPWLCCGVALILLVPVILLFLEIKGRRSPPIPPEPMLEGKRGNEE